MKKPTGAAVSVCGGSARHSAADPVYLLEEVERPGQLMPIMEDGRGTCVLNSKDLRVVGHVARTAQIYRHTINDAVTAGPSIRS